MFADSALKKATVEDMRGVYLPAYLYSAVARTDYTSQIGEHYTENISLAGALRLAVDALGHDGNEVRQLQPDQVEVAVLDRTRTQVRKFKRISEETLARILSESKPDTSPSEHAEHPEFAEATNGGSYESPADDTPVAPPQAPDDDRLL